MGICICGGSVVQCSFGAAPGTLNVLPASKVISSMPVASVMDNKPMVNIPAFGMCSSMANPQVAAATAAALGALTPMPCVPVITAPCARKPYCAYRRLSGFKQYIQSHLRLGRRGAGCISVPNHNTGALRRIANAGISIFQIK